MTDATMFVVVAAATLVLSLTPGPAVLYIVARGVEGGRPAGIVSAFGICAGELVHLAFAAIVLCTDLLYALLCGTTADWLRRNNESLGFRSAGGYASGSVYLAPGAATAVSGSGKD